jgi:predicted nucleic acid-binding protein
VILVDTSVWVDYFNGVASPPAEQLDRLLGEELILLGDLVLTETLQGFSSEQAAAAALEKLRAFALVSMVGWEIAVIACSAVRESPSARRSICGSAPSASSTAAGYCTMTATSSRWSITWA